MTDYIVEANPAPSVLVMLDDARESLAKLMRKVNAAGDLHGDGLALSLRKDLFAIDDALGNGRYRVARMLDEHAQELIHKNVAGESAVREAEVLVDGLTYFLTLAVADVERRYRKANRTEPSWIRSAQREIQRAVGRCTASTRELVEKVGAG